ncbi:formin-like protein 2 [Pecten maximus]|uniref:formin-like protein 2 n=1 Tax=Pecten maximus TaxID=6579 RepID=UPI001458E929|nr:formin-like protein 2 [Pecten maximus]
MFRAICDNFTRSTGTERLVPIETIIHANSIDLLQVVVQRREGHWSWHKYVYTPYDFKIKNILVNYKKTMKIKKKTSDFCTWSREIEVTLGGKMGRAILADLGDRNLSPKDTVRMEANVGETVMDKINPNKIYRKLLGRKINLDHPWVQQVIKDKKNVICVVQSIVKLAGDAEIKTTSIKKKSGEEETSDKSKDLGLVSGTPIAYKVIALQVGATSGVVVPCMGHGVKGGFMEDSKILGVPTEGAVDDSYESKSEDEDENEPKPPHPKPEPETTAEPVTDIAQTNEGEGIQQAVEIVNSDHVTPFPSAPPMLPPDGAVHIDPSVGGPPDDVLPPYPPLDGGQPPYPPLDGGQPPYPPLDGDQPPYPLVNTMPGAPDFTGEMQASLIQEFSSKHIDE